MGRQQDAGIAFGEIHLNHGASIFNRLFARVDGRGIMSHLGRSRRSPGWIGTALSTRSARSQPLAELTAKVPNARWGGWYWCSEPKLTDNPMRPVETGSVSQPSQCGARTRSGAPCKSAPVTGRRRCRMHGGADGSGAPKGERNGNYKHGRYTEEVRATRQWLREATQLLRSFK
jgi:hypothetical protein